MDDPFAEPADTREAILGAAFRALRKHGYANVTVKRIGEEFDKSPSLVYHHYDGKDDLLVDLMGYLLDQFEASIADGGAPEPPSGAAPDRDRSARAHLDAYLAAAVDPGSLDEPYAPDAQFVTVMTELRAQAASDDAYRDHFDRSDRVFGEYLARLVREAAAERADEGPPDRAPAADASPGAERSVPAAEVAATLQTFATGGMFRWATTTEGEWVARSRAGIDRYLEAVLPLVDVDEPAE